MADSLPAMLSCGKCNRSMGKNQQSPWIHQNCFAVGPTRTLANIPEYWYRERMQDQTCEITMKSEMKIDLHHQLTRN